MVPLLLDAANGIETGVSLRQAIRLVAAVLGGKTAEGGTSFRNLNDPKTVIAAGVNGNGDRVSVSRDLN